MSDMHREGEDEGAILERELLASWKSMKAPDDARKKALGVLAAGTAAVVATQAAVAASAGGKAAAVKSAGALAGAVSKVVAKVSAALNIGSAGAAGAAAAPVATGIVAKAVIAGAVVASTVVGVEVGVPMARDALEHRSTSGHVVAPAAPLAGASKAATREVAAPVETPAAAVDAVDTHEEVAAPEIAAPAPAEAPPAVTDTSEDRSAGAKDKPTVAPRTASNPVPAVPAEKAAPDLTASLRAITAGRKALDDRNPTEALSQLAAIDDGSPLAAEAMALRFEAFTRAGNRAAARGVAEKLVARFPESPYASRMRRALEGE